MGAVSEKIIYDSMVQARCAAKGVKPSNRVLWVEDIANGRLGLSDIYPTGDGEKMVRC